MQQFFGRVLMVVALLGIYLIPVAASACPNCKQAVASQKDQGLADGLNYTILGMIGLPFLLAGTVGAVTIRAYRRQGNDSRPGSNASPDDRGNGSLG